MGWTDEEIDEIAREASKQTAPEFKQEYWIEMEALLNAEKSNKKGGFWWFFGAPLVLALGGAIYFFATSNNDVAKNDVAQIVNEEIEGVEATNVNNTATSEIVSVETQKLRLTASQDIPANIQSSARTSISNASNDDSRHIMTERATQFIQITDHNDGSSANDELSVDLAQFLNSNSENSVQQTNVEKAKQTEEPIDAELNNKLQLEGDSNETVDQTNASEIVTFMDQSQNSDAQMFSEDKLLKRKYGFYAGINAGAGTSYMQNSKDLLIQWGAKIGYEYTFFDKLRLGTGLGFRQQIMKDLVLERNRTYYSLGLINVSQSIEYDRLHFVDLNIHAHYTYKKLAVGIQFTPSYLIGARANLVQTENNMDKVETNELTSEETLFVQTNNLNPFGLDAGISLQYQFKYKMLLDLSISSRLNKFLMDKGFVGNGNAFPLRLEIGIIKRF